MKKLLFVAAIAAFGYTNVNAQEDDSTFGFSEGDIFVEGNIGFNSSTDKDEVVIGGVTTSVETKTSGFDFNPKVGYLIADNFAVGVELGFGKSKEEAGSVISQDVSSFGGGVFARYYFLELGKRFKTYSELGLGYATAKNKVPTGTETTTETANIISAGLDLGANFFVTEKIAITFGIMDILSVSNNKTDVSTSNVPGKATTSGTDVSFNLGGVNNPFSDVRFGILLKF